MQAGSQVESHAIVLAFTPLKESDRLVHLFTLEYGRISAVAPQAARSIKRFGAALEPMSYIKAHLKVPRDAKGASENPLWRLEKADLRQPYLHFRKSYGLLESAFFVLRIVLDLVPEGHVDVELFKGLGRFFKESQNLDLQRSPAWIRAVFWDFFSRHLGSGELVEDLLKDRPADFVELWRSAVIGEPHFAKLFARLAQDRIPDLTLGEEIGIYEQWLKNSNIHWPYFEQWLQSKRHSS